MKLNKETVQVAVIGIIFIAAFLVFWIWFINETIANEPQFFLHMSIWLGPILVITLFRFVARYNMNEKERELDDIEVDGEKGTAISSLMTIWLLGYPLLMWIFG